MADQVQAGPNRLGYGDTARVAVPDYGAPFTHGAVVNVLDAEVQAGQKIWYHIARDGDWRWVPEGALEIMGRAAAPALLEQVQEHVEALLGERGVPAGKAAAQGAARLLDALASGDGGHLDDVPEPTAAELDLLEAEIILESPDAPVWVIEGPKQAGAAPAEVETMATKSNRHWQVFDPADLLKGQLSEDGKLLLNGAAAARMGKQVVVLWDGEQPALGLRAAADGEAEKALPVETVGRGGKTRRIDLREFLEFFGVFDKLVRGEQRARIEGDVLVFEVHLVAVAGGAQVNGRVEVAAVAT